MTMINGVGPYNLYMVLAKFRQHTVTAVILVA